MSVGDDNRAAAWVTILGDVTTCACVRACVSESQGLATAPRGPWGRETGRGRHQAYSVRGAHDLRIHSDSHALAHLERELVKNCTG